MTKKTYPPEFKKEAASLVLDQGYTRKAAIEGVEIALTDIGLVEREVKYNQLIIPFNLRLETKKAFYLAYQAGHQFSYGMQAFYDWIVAEMEAETEVVGNRDDSKA